MSSPTFFGATLARSQIGASTSNGRQPSLIASVACRWVSRPDPRAAGRVLPDACIDVIWDGVPVFVVGPDTAAVEIEARLGRAFAGVRFRPGRASAYLGVPAHHLLNQRVPLEDLFGPREVRWLSDRLAASPTMEAAADLLDEAVAGRTADALEPDPIVDALIALLAFPVRTHDSVRAAGSQLSIGERRLHRRCCAAFGFEPKTLERILRFQKAIRLGRPDSSLALVAVQAGYADQAHLSRECRRLSGCTPSVLFKTADSAAT